MTNLSAHNKEMEHFVFNTICSSFPLIIKLPIPEYTHDVIVGMQLWREDIAGVRRSCDSHVTGDDDCKDKEVKSELVGQPLLIPKQLRSNFNLLSCSVGKSSLTKEFVDYFKDGFLYC